MTDEELAGPLFEDDPVLGAYIAHYPGNRLRLIIIGGAVLIAVYFVFTVALWQVEETVASITTIVIIAITTLFIGWYASHLWNREVVLYEKGFSYREGSTMAYIPYKDVVSFHQSGQIISYFGGLFKRNTLQFKLITSQDETIVLNILYRHLNRLGERLETRISQAQVEQIQILFDSGERFQFSDTLELSAEGLHSNLDTLPWERFSHYHIRDGHLIIIDGNNEDWLYIPLTEINHIRVLIYMLRQQHLKDNTLALGNGI